MPRCQFMFSGTIFRYYWSLEMPLADSVDAYHNGSHMSSEPVGLVT